MRTAPTGTVPRRALVSTGTSAAEFESFAAALDLPVQYPSLQAINYTALVHDADLEAFVAARRAEGEPGFRRLRR